MIVDFRTLPADAEIGADICIIGTGPAGLAVAREFFGTSTGVVVLESGGLGFEPASERLNAGESASLHYVGLTHGRRRQFGGTANIWGAVCAELEASDFAYRPWIAGSGWPITGADVAPFYRRARELFKIAPTDHDAADWRAFGMESAAFDAAALRFSVAGTTPIPNLGKAYRNDVRAAGNVTLLLHAIVTVLSTNADGEAMQRVEVRSLEGKRGTVNARIFVLCCGGIENARRLLASRDVHRNGLGNGHDLVGRYLSDHIRSMSARIVPAPGRSLQPLFRSVRHGRVTLRPRLSLPPERQADAGVLNCMAQVHFDYPNDGGFTAAHSLRRAIRFRRMPDDFARDMQNVLRHPRELARMAIDRYVRGLHPADGASQLRLESMAEQAPNAESRVTLAQRSDRFGIPLPFVDWRCDDIERRTIAYMTESVSREFRQLGLGEVQPEAWLADGGTTDWQAHLNEGFHHMGTTRMAASPRAGVVDSDCKVHDIEGLYVAGSSTFPASGYANPTLTIVALAIRLADHLKRRLRSPLRSVQGAEVASASQFPARVKVGDPAIGNDDEHFTSHPFVRRWSARPPRAQKPSSGNSSATSSATLDAPERRPHHHNNRADLLKTAVI
jgi:choline dehydrogenase-like flavoprotein